MNNFKKLLASAMALTMVTSVIPATSVSADSSTTCSADLYEQGLVTATVDAIVKDIEAAGYTLSNVPFYGQDGSTFNVRGSNTAVRWWNYNAATLQGSTVSDGATLSDVVNSAWVNGLLDIVKGCDAYAGNVKKLAEMENAVNQLKDPTVHSDLSSLFAKNGPLADGISEDEWKGNNSRNFEELYNEYKGYESYLGNIVVGEVGKGAYYDVDEDMYDAFVDNMASFDEAVDDYKNEFYDDFAETYIKELKEVVFAKELELDDNGKYQGDSLEDLKEKLEKVQDSDDYGLCSDEDEIVKIIDTIENIIADLETVDELLDSSSDAQRALRSVRSDVNRLAAAGNDAAALAVIDDFTAEDIENVQTYVEEVVNEFYTYETRQRSSGRYYVREEGTELAVYIDDDDVNTNVRALLKTIFDADERSEDTVYDVLVDTDTTVVTKADLIAIVEEAEGVELKWTYTTGEVDLVEDALDALDLLFPTKPSNVTDEDFNADPYGLNAREERTLKAEQARLERIHSRMENAEAEIIVTKDWWVFENGQWVFYQDGRTVSNVWVADHNNDWYYAGANGVMLTNSWIARDSSLSVWYYVGADGKMVTNTVVDGYTIDANGEWHA